MTFLYSSNLVKCILSEWALNTLWGKKKVNKTSSYEEFGIKKKKKNTNMI